MYVIPLCIILLYTRYHYCPSYCLLCRHSLYRIHLTGVQFTSLQPVFLLSPGAGIESVEETAGRETLPDGLGPGGELAAGPVVVSPHLLDKGRAAGL